MTVFTVPTETVNLKDVFGVPVGLIVDESPIEKERYEPKNRLKGMLTGTAATAAGAGTLTGVAVGAEAVGSGVAVAAGATAGIAVFGTVAAAGAAVGGAVLGVDQLFQAFTHQRVTYITIHNKSKSRSYTFLQGYNNSGHATVPDKIPPNTTVRMAFHNTGSFSGAVQFTSNGDYLYIGSSNPSIGKNKLRVECVAHAQLYELKSYWDDMGVWNVEACCGRNVVLSDGVYDNPSRCTVTINEW